MVKPNTPPPDYHAPAFPSLNVHTLYDLTIDKKYTLYYIRDIWRFTVAWTAIVYAAFHLGAVGIAFFTHKRSKYSWRYLWAVPIVYLLSAGFEALISGSIVGLALSAVYRAGYFEMNTWIPFSWSLISVLILIISSFTIQGGL